MPRRHSFIDHWLPHIVVDGVLVAVLAGVIGFWVRPMTEEAVLRKENADHRSTSAVPSNEEALAARIREV